MRPKRFWQYIKVKCRDSTGMAVLKSHGKEFTTPKEKADILDEQYDSVFTLEDPVLPQLPDSPYPDKPNIHIDNNGVIKLPSRLNPSKANGPDLLPTCILKEVATEKASYLCFIFQHPSTSYVRSGFPQGTVLGPLCFLLFINDIHVGNDITSNIKLFADNTLLHGLVHNSDDAISLQSDLDKLVEWAKLWQMAFNPSKCYVLRVCRTKYPFIHQYTMLGHTLQLRL